MRFVTISLSTLGIGSGIVCCYASIRRWRRSKAASLRLKELLDTVAGEDARIVITGASSGIGRELANQFAKHPHVSLLLGNPGLAKSVQGERTRILPLELLDFNSVERFAREAHTFLAGGKRGLRLIVNNAAIKEDPGIADKICEGHELTYHRDLDQGKHICATWQINFLGPYLLTELLCHLREKDRINRPVRCVNVASGHEHESQLNDEILESISSGGCTPNEYADAKRALLLWTSIRAQNFAFRSHLFVHASDPGKVDTRLGLHWIPDWLWTLSKPIRIMRFKSVAEGALSLVAAGLRPEATYKFGQYLGGEKLLEDLVVCRMPEKRVAQSLVGWAHEVTALEARSRGQLSPVIRGRVKTWNRDATEDRWSTAERRWYFKEKLRAKFSRRCVSCPNVVGMHDSHTSLASLGA